MFIGNKSYAEIFSSLNTSPWKIEEQKLLMEIVNNNTSHYPYKLEKELKKAIIDCNFDEIQRLSEEFSSYPPSNLCKNNPIRSHKNNIICNCTILTRIAIEAGVDEKLVFFLSDLYINKTEEIDDIELLSNFNAVILVNFISKIKKTLAHKHLYSDITKNAIQYINKNLDRNITLDEVAKFCNSNSSYLSRIFKKEVGQNFTQYIHTNRIDQAKELLLFSDLSLLDISDKLGFSSQSHFNKIFKQYANVSPKQFKENYK